MTADSADPRFNPFVSKPEYLNKNRRIASSMSVRSAQITQRDQTHENGVAIMENHFPLAVLTREQAAKIAADIVDVLTHHNQKESTND